MRSSLSNYRRTSVIYVIGTVSGDEIDARLAFSFRDLTKIAIAFVRFPFPFPFPRDPGASSSRDNHAREFS